VEDGGGQRTDQGVFEGGGGVDRVAGARGLCDDVCATVVEWPRMRFEWSGSSSNHARVIYHQSLPAFDTDKSLHACREERSPYPLTSPPAKTGSTRYDPLCPSTMIRLSCFGSSLPACSLQVAPRRYGRVKANEVASVPALDTRARLA